MAGPYIQFFTFCYIHITRIYIFIYIYMFIIWFINALQANIPIFRVVIRRYQEIKLTPPLSFPRFIPTQAII